MRPLAATLLRKTDGNPFFMQQFLTALARAAAASRSTLTRRRWTWDDARSRRRSPPTTSSICWSPASAGCPTPRADVLTFGACIGQEFDLGTLSPDLASGPIADLTGGIWEALREGLLIPLDASYRFLAESAKASDDLGEAISLPLSLPARPRPAGRLRAGRRRASAGESTRESAACCSPAGQRAQRREPVRDRAADEPRPGVDHSDAERAPTLARFNLGAGIKMAASGAHASALDLLRRCLELLGPNAWADEHATTYRAHLALAECEFMSGNVAGASQLLDIVEARSRTALERVAGREIRIIVMSANAHPS